MNDQIPNPNPMTQAAIAEARAMKTARFATADELFAALEDKGTGDITNAESEQ